ncbi:unnamed protein product [Bursaphelenchus xylophilus]|uniref:(pine wood nematode) hypothetical protein n=1 Tax=Bursaphelenchus xylophilus TaxID=6326 RepID=A0A1I7RQY4_BURXY|nr:unnamed protein product [Bursaphelenchus xylophilus]CAG9130747.1 unnamed protein product [Bursaphelenchus xylophilus]
MISLKNSDIDHMEQCLQRKFKGAEAHESGTSSPLTVGGRASGETPFRVPRRQEGFAPARERPQAVQDNNQTPTSTNHGNQASPAQSASNS